MNTREKKLIAVLFGAAFLIVNVFLFTSYTEAKQRKTNQLNQGAKQLKQMKKELGAWKSQAEDVEWLSNNQPVEGTHGEIGADLTTYIEKSALRNRVKPRTRPSLQPQDLEESGAYRSATVRVAGNATDRELYMWMVDLQDPKKMRSITRLNIRPQRDGNDASKADCELEVTQWFTPKPDDDEAVTAN